MPPKPQGDRAMTVPERVNRHRLKRKAEAQRATAYGAALDAIRHDARTIEDARQIADAARETGDRT